MTKREDFRSDGLDGAIHLRDQGTHGRLQPGLRVGVERFTQLVLDTGELQFGEDQDLTKVSCR